MNKNKTIKFLEKYCFQPIPLELNDTYPVQCTFCGKEAWLPKDVIHKEKCELKEVLEELQKGGGK